MSWVFLIPILAILGGLGIPLSAIWTSHRREMIKMQMQMQSQGDANLRASIEALRDEVRDLKDTTMQYDLSFDNALQRMEQRMEGLERRVNTMESSQTVLIGRGD